MSKITISTTIDRDREAVAEALTDGESFTGIDGFLPLIEDWEIVEYDEPRRLRLHGQSPSFEATVVFYLSAAEGVGETDGAATRLKVVTVYDVLPDQGLLAEFLDWAILHRVLSRMQIRAIEAFEADLEGRTADTVRFVEID